jgi:hypothetical protein
LRNRGRDAVTVVDDFDGNHVCSGIWIVAQASTYDLNVDYVGFGVK